jgi:hypothetical protein
MVDKPYLVRCKECNETYERENNYPFVCRECKVYKKQIKDYPKTFYRNSKIAMKRDGRRCQCCKAKSHLIIHHMDCNKLNNSPTNLITLCQQCHMHLHAVYSRKTLRQSNIYKLFPKTIRFGQFGKRLITKVKKIDLPKLNHDSNKKRLFHRNIVINT